VSFRSRLGLGVGVLLLFGLSTGILISAPSTADASYYRRTTITYAVGTTPIPADMPCADCHEGYPAAHPIANCTTCHAEAGGFSKVRKTGLAGGCYNSRGNCHPTFGSHYDAYEVNEADKPFNWSEPMSRVGCTKCHSTGNPLVPQHTQSSVSAAHETVVTLGCAGATCHAGTNLLSVHSVPCSTCHGSNSAAVRLSISEGDSACTSCHTAIGTEFHLDFDTLHTFSAMDASCQGAGCHTNSLPAAHANAVGEGSANPQYADACALCHRNEDSERIPSDASAECTSCHGPIHADVGPIHTSTPSSETMTVLGTSYGTHACSECHDSSDLRDLHADCGTCHPSPANTATPYAKGCVQGGCHTAGSSAPKHAALDSAHLIAQPSCVAAGCHTGGTSVAAIHATQGCATCHGAGKTPTVVCATCHEAEPHRALHDPGYQSGSVRFFDNHEGWSPLDYGVECSWCHGTANLIDVHSNNCAVCHTAGGPRSTFTSWNSTCQQGGCHVTYHDLANAGHESEYGSSDCETYCHNSDWSVPAENCGGCHTLVDSVAPTTGSNAATTYTGTARVTLSATDPFPSSGIAHIYYRLDGGAQTEGSAIVIPGPVSGSSTHTLEFWSVDNAGLSESPHTVKLINLLADSQKPSTTSNAKTSYVGPAVIRFTATDNGSAGVMTTYYSVDGGPPVAGTTATVPQPSSGTAAHTVSFWSVDWSGNVEDAHLAEFTNSIDSTAPTTTETGITTWLRTNFPGVDLVSTDVGDAGVAYSYGRVDNGTTYGGASGGSLRIYPYASDGMHTFKWWSVDAVGNVESVNTTSFGVDRTAPVSTAVAQNNYYGTAVLPITSTDNLSGVKATYYRIDGGAPQVGTTVTILPPASGSAYHYVYVYSEDNAGNLAMTRSYYFYVSPATADTTPPTGTMGVNSGAAYAPSIAATLHSSMSDAGSGMSQMRIDPGSGVYGAWIAYSVAAPITIPGADGLKTVRAEYRDVSGNVASRTDTITLDTAAPEGSIMVNGGAPEASSLQATLDSSVTDAYSGLDRMRVDPGSGTYGGWVAYAPSMAIALPSGEGTKTVRAQFSDKMGHTATMVDEIRLVAPSAETTPPVTTSNAVSAYTGGATITLTAADEVGGSGLLATYYILDGGPPVAGTAVVVEPPASGSVAHTLEFWSVDYAGNIEAHKTVEFTVAVLVPGTGTIVFLWESPPSDAWADFYIDGAFVASRSMADDEYWDGSCSIQVPVRATAYDLSSEWYDSNWSSEPGWSYSTALIDSPGKIVYVGY